MTPTEAAILSRCRGDRGAAFEYCRQIAVTYPELRTEYMTLAFKFGFDNRAENVIMLAKGAHV